MSAPERLDARRDGGALLVSLAAALAIQLPLYDRWLNLLDEGAIAQIADQINHGMPPYRHAVHLALPGVFYLTAGLYQLFGTSFLVGRVFMLVIFAAFVACFYVLARSVSGRGVALGVTLLAVAYRVWAFPHWQMISYTPLAILCLMLCVTLLSFDLARPRPWLPPAAGLLLGVGALFKQDVAGVTAVVLAPFLLLVFVRRSGRFRASLARVLGFGIAALLPVAAVVFAFAADGLAEEMLYQTIWVPLVAKPMWAQATAEVPYRGFPPLWPPWAVSPEIRGAGLFAYFPSLLLDLFWRELISHPLFRASALPELFVRAAYLLPPALLALLIGRACARGRKADDGSARERLWLIFAFAAALLLSFNRPRDWIHLMALYAPTLLLLAPSMEWLRGGAAGRRRRLVDAAGMAVVALALACSFALAAAARDAYAIPIEHPRVRLRERADVAAVIEPLVRDLAPPRGQAPAALAALPASPTLNFITGRPLATRFLTLLPLEEYPDRDAQIVSDFARQPGLDVVYALPQAGISVRPQDYAPGVFAFLTRHYELGAGPGGSYAGTRPEGLLLARLRPRTPVAETVLYDFAAQLDEARVEPRALLEPAPGSPGPPRPAQRIDVWPFEAPVLAVTPAPPPAVHALTYEVELEEPALLRFGVAMDPDTWASFLTISLHFAVRIDGRKVFETTLDPRRRLEDRRYAWQELEVAAGRHTIRFETGTDSPLGAEAGVAGWARPRLVARDGFAARARTRSPLSYHVPAPRS